MGALLFGGACFVQQVTHLPAESFDADRSADEPVAGHWVDFYFDPVVIAGIVRADVDEDVGVAELVLSETSRPVRVDFHVEALDGAEKLVFVELVWVNVAVLGCDYSVRVTVFVVAGCPVAHYVSDDLVVVVDDDFSIDNFDVAEVSVWLGDKPLTIGQRDHV